MKRSLFAACLILCTGPATAHALLQSATPAVGSTMRQPPGEVVLSFSEGVEPRFSTITVQDAAGADVESGAVHLAGGDTHLAVGLKPLAAGIYAVVWHAVSVDTHRTEGRFTFTVQP